MTPMKVSLSDIRELIHLWINQDYGSMIKTHLSQTRQNLINENGNRYNSNPNQDVTCKWYLKEKGKLVFSNVVTLSLSIIFQGRPDTQEYLDNTKRGSCFCCYLFFCHIVFFVHIFCLEFFSYWERWRKKSWSWVYREVGRIWEEVCVRKNMTKI